MQQYTSAQSQIIDNHMQQYTSAQSHGGGGGGIIDNHMEHAVMICIMHNQPDDTPTRRMICIIRNQPDDTPTPIRSSCIHTQPHSIKIHNQQPRDTRTISSTGPTKGLSNEKRKIDISSEATIPFCRRPPMSRRQLLTQKGFLRPKLES